VLEHRLDVVVGRARHRVPRDDDLVAGVDGFERHAGDPDVHRHARDHHGVHAEVPEDGVELGAVERCEPVEARQDEVVVGGRERRDDRVLRRARRETHPTPRGGGQQQAVGCGAAAVGAARHGAVDHADAGFACRPEQAGDVLDRPVTRDRLR